jgi:hypothetical protein
MKQISTLCTLFFILGSILFTGCALFREAPPEIEPITLLGNVNQEEAAITHLFANYTQAMSTKDLTLFKGCFSPTHTHNYKDELRSFNNISRKCDLNMQLQRVVLYYLTDYKAIAEVTVETRYLHLPQEKRDELKDFRLITRFQLRKIDGHWIIENNLPKYNQIQPL